MTYLLIGLGALSFCLIGYVVYQAKKLGRLQSELSYVERKYQQLKEAQKNANDILSGPVSDSIGDALDSMPK